VTNNNSYIYRGQKLDISIIAHAGKLVYQCKKVKSKRVSNGYTLYSTRCLKYFLEIIQKRLDFGLIIFIVVAVKG
jgi:hypothetical protein